MDENELALEECKGFVTVCSAYFKGHTCDEIMNFCKISALCALEKIALNKGITTDYSKYQEIAVDISHCIENELRDYIEFHSDKEYMKKKTNLSSPYGMTVEDPGNAD